MDEVLTGANPRGDSKLLADIQAAERFDEFTGGIAEDICDPRSAPPVPKRLSDVAEAACGCLPTPPPLSLFCILHKGRKWYVAAGSMEDALSRWRAHTGETGHPSGYVSHEVDAEIIYGGAQ